MTSEGAENFFSQYLGINISFSHLYRISKTNSCHKCATALKPAKKKERYAFHRVGRGEEGGEGGESGRGEEGGGGRGEGEGRGGSRGRGGGGGGRQEKGGGGRGGGGGVEG